MAAPSAVAPLVSPAVSALERLERALHPARVDAIISEASDEDLRVLYLQGRAMGRLAWVTMSLVVGHAITRADETESHLPAHMRASVTSVAKAIGVHKSKISRAAKIYRRILRPRLDAEGDAANFVIDGRVYYELAIEAAEFSGHDALEIIAIAEDRMTAGGGYSLRRYRQELIDRGWLPVEMDGSAERTMPPSLDSRVNELRAILQRLVAMEDDVLDRAASQWASDVTAHGWVADGELILTSLLDRLAIAKQTAPEATTTDEEPIEEEPKDGN